MQTLQAIQAAGTATEAKGITYSDADRLAAAVSMYSPVLYRMALRKLGNIEDTEDALQEAFLSAFKHIGQFRGQAKFSTWLGTIVLNSARMHLRRRLSRSFVSLDENDENPAEGNHVGAEWLEDRSPDAEQAFRRRQQRETLECAAEILPTRLREAFRLRVFEGLTASETARVLRVPVGTVKARFFRARLQVIALMRNHLNSPQKKHATASKR
jgi:RNA polymerase sigma-70 factor, ECF subfamily